MQVICISHANTVSYYKLNFSECLYEYSWSTEDENNFSYHHQRGFKVVSLVLPEDTRMSQTCVGLPAWAQISLSGCCLAAGRSRTGKSTSGRVASSAARTHRPRWTACLEECLHLDQTRGQKHTKLADYFMILYNSTCLSCSNKVNQHYNGDRIHASWLKQAKPKLYTPHIGWKEHTSFNQYKRLTANEGSAQLLHLLFCCFQQFLLQLADEKREHTSGVEWSSHGNVFAALHRYKPVYMCLCVESVLPCNCVHGSWSEYNSAWNGPAPESFCASFLPVTKRSSVSFNCLGVRVSVCVEYIKCCGAFEHVLQ